MGQDAGVTTGTGWDGEAYDALAGPQRDVGARLLDRLEVAEGAVVVDAGCGSGRVTELLLDRHPTASVVGLDASASMLAAAADRLARHGGRVRLVEADLAEPWPFAEPVDVVVSTNAFHWVRDHDRLFAAAFAALRPGGELHAVAGGAGSLASVRDAARLVGVEVDGRNHYADAASTTRRLEAAGFVDVRCALEEEPVRFASREALARYLADAALAPYEHGAERAPLVAEALDEPVADFVRLTLTARRPALRG